jgi:hypothetical protein
MAPHWNNDFEFESLKSFETTERHAGRNEKKQEVTVTATTLQSSSGSDDDSRHPPLATSPILRFVDQWWIFELLAWVASVASLVFMVAILRVRDGNPTPKVGNHNSPSQCPNYHQHRDLAVCHYHEVKLDDAGHCGYQSVKWNWFYQGRPVTDFQLFDSAKGGPLGALTLLWRPVRSYLSFL